MIRRKVIGLGAGGHAKVLLDVLLDDPSIEVVGLLDPEPAKWGKRLLGVEILGPDSLLPKLKRAGVAGFFLGLGSTGKLALRKELFDAAIKSGLEAVTIKHPTAIISRHAKIARGACIMAAAVVNAGSRIGMGACVNTGAIIEHDCLLGAHSFVGPGARLAGGVHVGALAFVGIGATVRQGVRIGAGALVGAGAVAVKNVGSRQTVAGVPARLLIRQ